MPYKVDGNRVLHYKDGKWSTKQVCSSNSNAKAAMRLLYGIEGGMKPRNALKKAVSGGSHGVVRASRTKKKGE